MNLLQETYKHFDLPKMKPIQVLSEQSISDLKTILEFVELWNKQDKDEYVAHAHHRLEELVTELEEK